MAIDRFAQRGLILGSCLALFGASAFRASHAATAEESSESLAPKIEKLVVLGDLDSKRSRQEVARAIAALGEAAVPPLFHAVRDRSWPRDESGGAKPLAAAQRAVSLEALELLREPHTLAFLEQTIESDRSEDRVAALTVLAEIGVGRDLNLAVRLAAVAGENGELEPASIGWFGLATRRIVERDHRGYDRLRKIWPPLHDALRPAAIEAIGANGHPDGLELAVGFVDGRDPAIDQEVLRQVRHIGRRLLVLPSDLSLGPIREYLWHDDPLLRTDATRCVGSLRDVGSVERLIELLDDADDDVRDSALRGLKETTGLGFPNQSQRWSLWYQDELEWHEREFTNTVDRARSGDPTQASVAIQELARHPLCARDAVEELSKLLRSDEPMLRRMACAGMEQLGSPAAIPALLDRLGDDDSSVAEAAARAMRTLTGKSLDPNADAWCAAFPELRAHR